MKHLLLISLLVSTAFAGQTVTLQNGKVLKDFEILSYGSNVVTAKWDGGRGTIPYHQLPNGIRESAQQNRKEDDRKPSESLLSVAKQRAAQERRMVNAKNKMERYESAVAQGKKPPMLKSEYDEARVEYRDAKMKFDELSRKMN